MTTRNVTAYSAIACALGCGGISLLLFGYFLVVGPLSVAALSLSGTGRLFWDALLSILFFSQHSGLIRRGVRSRIARFIPDYYYPALYAIASGIALLLVVLLWQPSDTVCFEFEGRLRWLPRLISLAAVAGFAWGVVSLGSFDFFGLDAIRDHLQGEDAPRSPFVVRGPYRHVRHPLYSLTLVLIWSSPQVTSDRLLLNLLWTAWVVAGTYLEEQDLVAEFGEAYRAYQDTVPILVPWRLLVGRRGEGGKVNLSRRRGPTSSCTHGRSGRISLQ